MLRTRVRPGKGKGRRSEELLFKLLFKAIHLSSFPRDEVWGILDERTVDFCHICNMDEKRILKNRLLFASSSRFPLELYMKLIGSIDDWVF